MENQAVILLSGGLDSVFNLYCAHEKWGGRLSALCLNYGQKAWEKELAAAQYFSNELKVCLQTLDVTYVFKGGKSSLTTEAVIPTDEVNIESLEASERSAEKVWVPNRNGVLLNLAACVAETQGASFVVPGFNAEEAATFPDNSVEYIEKMNECLMLSTSNGVQIHCFSQDMQKSEMAQKLSQWSVNLDKIWSCYKNGEVICGECESCQRFLRAKNSVVSQ